MHIPVTVVPDADTDKVEDKGGRLRVYTRMPAEGGKANQAMIKLVCNNLSVDGPVRIVSGHRKRHKVLEIPDNL